MKRIIRIGMDVHSTNYTLCAMEPILGEDDRIFATVDVSPAACLFGMITPCAPARLAVRIIAPRLWGSSISSRRKMKGASPFSFALFKISSTVDYSYAATCAITP